MKQKITFLFLLSMSCSGLIFGQVSVDNFDTGASASKIGDFFGASSAVVANPDASGINTTSNCLRIGRTGNNWFALVGFDVDPDISIATGDTKFLSLKVYSSVSTDMRCRFDATADQAATQPHGATTINSLNEYTTLNEWQEIIIPIVEEDGDENSTVDTTLFRISFHPEVKGFSNDPDIPTLLNDTDTFLYIDELQILEKNPLPALSTSGFELKNSISLSPNPAQSSFKIKTLNNVGVQNVSIFNMLGKQVANFSQTTKDEFDISNLTSGLYLIKVIDSNGGSATKKLLKK